MFSLNNGKAVRRAKLDIENKIKARLERIMFWKWSKELKERA